MEIPPPIPAKIDVAGQPIQEVEEEDDEEKLGLLPFTYTFNITNNKYILKLAANKNKCVIYVALEDPLDQYYYFTELTKEELIDINKIFINCNNIKEAIDFFKNLIENKSDEKRTKPKCNYSCDGEVFVLGFNVNLLSKDIKFEIFLIKKMKNKDKLFDKALSRIKNLTKENKNLSDQVSNLEKIVTAMSNPYKENKNLSDQVSNLEKIVAAMSNPYNALTKENKNLSDKVSNLEKIVTAMSKQINLDLDNYKTKFNKTESTILDTSTFITVYNLFELSKENLTLKLLYRATKENDTSEKLYEEIKGETNTIVLIETKNGNIFGGYTSAQWPEKNEKTKETTALLFSITKNKVYKAKENTYGSVIENTDYCFPSFINGFSLKNNYFSSCWHNTKKLEVYQNTWDNFTYDYELNDGKENFEVKNLEVFKVVGENSVMELSFNNLNNYSYKHNDFKFENHYLSHYSHKSNRYCNENKSKIIYKKK